MITAQCIRQDNFTFKATHSLFVTTNYIPVVNETDHGTWRRLQLVRFPYTFRKPGHELLTPYDRIREPNLKARIRANATGQWDAIVTWALDGAIEYYNIEAIDPGRALEPTARIAEDTGARRAEADRILGFWLEHAVASADWGMVCSEVLDAFNDWLVENGHTKWTKETFVTRFLQHSVSVHHGIERKQVRTKGRNIWRYGRWEFAGHSELKEREWCFLGIRLRS